MKHEHRPIYTGEAVCDTGHSHEHRGVERRRLLASMILTGLMMVVELVGGILSNSLALVSDAGHMFTHFFALGLSFFAIVVACRPAAPERSFGYYRAEILAAFTNGLVLLAVTVYILYEAVVRFIAPKPIEASEMFWVALAGLAVNLATAVLLWNVGREDLNVKSAFLHMLADTVSSVAVVSGAVAIHYTGLVRIDPVLSAVIAVMIGVWSYKLLRDSGNVLLETTPKHVNLAEVREELHKQFPEIKGLHDLHVWQITSGMCAMTVHITVEAGLTVEKIGKLKEKLEPMMREKFKVGHTAFQFEAPGAECEEENQAEACTEWKEHEHEHNHEHGDEGHHH